MSPATTPTADALWYADLDRHGHASVLLPDGSIAAISSGLLSGRAAVVQRVRPGHHWKSATVTVTERRLHAAPGGRAPTAPPGFQGRCYF
ncbi:hypothetical protein [Streptomyces sp. GbtcB7]|uniref:hypothetical protein n=1 Tax=Streptomyces sp. GbtcB7 TaxID=2824752 RepID=UPI001C2F58DA|nr:hypothetical protein [Streptomyces sp. GbtcB7]